MRTENSQLGAWHEVERGRGSEGSLGGTTSYGLGLICKLDGGPIQSKERRY